MRKGRKLITCSQLETEMGLTRDPVVITETFRNFFENVYSPLESEHFDEEFKISVEHEISNIKARAEPILNCPELSPNLTPEIVLGHIRSLKNKKAPSFDMICNEHIKYGGHKLLTTITELFNLIIQTGKLPKKCKMGMIIPVFKNNGKPRTQPINYRPITLLPCIYKLFEKVLHERLNNWVNENKIAFPNRQQNAYQKCTGAITASFNLQEGIYQNNELNSNVYVCMLDTKQAFDTVVLDGVFYKMSTLSITGKIWRLLVDAHTNMSS